MAAQAYPLQWPEGWPRTQQYRLGSSRFGKNLGASQIARLQNGLFLMEARNVVISSQRADAPG